MSPLAAAAVALSFAASATPSPEVTALVRRCVEAHGGKAALARSARSRVEGTVTSLVLHPGQTGRIRRTHERPGRLRVEIAYPSGAAEVRVLDGARAWRDGEEVAGMRLDAMVLQAARVDLVALLESSPGRIRDGGVSEISGTKVRLLAVEPAPGLLVEAAIDPETGHILRSRGASTNGPVPIEFATTYSDFRQVDGVLVPMREENWANGRSTGVTALEKVSFPEAMPSGTFRP